eukprot:IDg21695t1
MIADGLHDQRHGMGSNGMHWQHGMAYKTAMRGAIYRVIKGRPPVVAGGRGRRHRAQV